MSNNSNTKTTQQNNNTKTSTQNDNKEQDQPKKSYDTSFRRIKIVDLPRDVTREHIEELCSKYGRINEIEMRRAGKILISFVTFSRIDDAEFALYRLMDMIYLGNKIKAFPAELTQEEIDEREKERKERERKRLEGREKKKKFVKPPKQSLRHLAPRNTPTTGNNNQKGNQQVRNTQQNQNQGQNQGGNQGRKKQNQGGNNGQGNRNQGGQRQNQGGNQGRKKQNQDGNNGQGNRNQGGQRQNQGGNNDYNRFKGKYRVKNQQSTNENYEEPIKEVQQTKNGEPMYEVIVRNINTNKQLFNITLSEEGLKQYFPPEERSKLIENNDE